MRLNRPDVFGAHVDIMEIEGLVECGQLPSQDLRLSVDVLQSINQLDAFCIQFGERSRYPGSLHNQPFK